MVNRVNRNKWHEAGWPLGCSVRRRQSYLLKTQRVDSREARPSIFIHLWHAGLHRALVGLWVDS